MASAGALYGRDAANGYWMQSNVLTPIFSTRRHLSCKLSLSTALAARVLKSVVLTNIRLPVTSAFVTRAMSATRAYADKAKTFIDKKTKKYQMNEPHTHVFNAFLNAAANSTKVVGHEIVTAYTEKLRGLVAIPKGLQQIASGVKYARISKQWDPQYKRIEFNAKENTEEHHVFYQCLLPTILAEGGAEELEGVAPPGDLERKVQEAINVLDAQSR